MSLYMNNNVGALQKPTITKRLVTGAMAIALAVSAYAGITASAATNTTVSGTNFNTHSDADYKGVNVGFTVSNDAPVEPLTEVKVSLYADNQLLVTNVGTPALYELYDGSTEFSTPFITFHSNTAYSNDTYWQFGEWNEMVAPDEARVTVNGQMTTLTSTLTEPNGWTFSSLMPEFYGENFNTHVGADYQGVNVGFHADGFEELDSVEVSLYDENNKLLVTNTGTEELFALYADGENKFSTPFITSNGSYDLGDEFWNFGQWSSFTQPAYAEVTVNGETVRLENLTGPEFEDLDTDNSFILLTKEACRNSGWKALDLGFKNQGQCVSKAVSSSNSAHNR